MGLVTCIKSNNKKRLLSALYKIVADDKPFGHNFIKSGNLLNRLREVGIDSAVELSDISYERVAKEKEVVEKGYMLGRLNRTKKPVYRIEFAPYVLFYIGTEADVLRKIEQYSAISEDSSEEHHEANSAKNEILAATVKKKSSLLKLPDWIQEQIAREYLDEDVYGDEYDKGMRQIDNEIKFELVEFDPRNKTDAVTLKELLKQKISDEGEPDEKVVQTIGKDGEIRDPILILSGKGCVEGRHRLAAALRYNLTIKAWCGK